MTVCTSMSESDEANPSPRAPVHEPHSLPDFNHAPWIQEAIYFLKSLRLSFKPSGKSPPSAEPGKVFQSSSKTTPARVHSDNQIVSNSVTLTTLRVENSIPEFNRGRDFNLTLKNRHLVTVEQLKSMIAACFQLEPWEVKLERQVGHRCGVEVFGVWPWWCADDAGNKFSWDDLKVKDVHYQTLKDSERFGLPSLPTGCYHSVRVSYWR